MMPYPSLLIPLLASTFTQSRRKREKNLASVKGLALVEWGGGGVQMKNWIDFNCGLVIKLSWCQVVSFSFDISNNRFLFRFSSGKSLN